MSGVDYFSVESSYPRSASDQSSISAHRQSVSNTADMVSNNPYKEHMGVRNNSFKKCAPSRATAAVFSSGYEFQNSHPAKLAMNYDSSNCMSLQTSSVVSTSGYEWPRQRLTSKNYAQSRASAPVYNSGYINSDSYQEWASMKYGPQAYAPAPWYPVEHVPVYESSRLSTCYQRGQSPARHLKYKRFSKESGIINPDKVDQMDGSTDIAYHHDCRYDAVYAERNYNKKTSPLEAVKESNAQALAATPVEKIIDSLQSGRPLDGVAFCASGQTDRNGRTFDYEEESDSMMNDIGLYITVPRFTDEDFENDEFTNMPCRSPFYMMKKLFSGRHMKRTIKALAK